MRTSLMLGVTAAVMGFAVAASATTLEDVKKKGFVQCGVSQGLKGFSNPDDKGDWTGIDVDFCRGIAAAIFGDPEKVKFTPLSAKERFTALQSGEIDVLSRNTTWAISRDTALGFDFRGVTFYDGQGFMVRKSSGVKSALELDGATICVLMGTSTPLTLADFFRANNMKYEPVQFEKDDEVVATYESGRCDAYTSDQSGLYANRLTLKNPDEHIVLPEIISKEPLGAVVRHGDNQWGDIVTWTLFAMLNAEELEVSSSNAEGMRASENPEIRRLLGTEGKFGEGMGLSDDWAFNIIAKVGNYAEIYDRNVGEKSPLGIPRGLNALWNKGGVQYAAPIR
ncbi:MAG TPA: amino acid ABC transporter substrate-binding protein [Alphaproteobacteria bacterium]|jgi:general L-amino acid transport system substrate-binding protein|nr:amino acid ABC transporter substrate-binding protein [Alphaproteobacteria bacterium]